MYFCIKSSMGAQGEVGHYKSALNPPPPPVVYSTDHSKRGRTGGRDTGIRGAGDEGSGGGGRG